MINIHIFVYIYIYNLLFVLKLNFEMYNNNKKQLDLFFWIMDRLVIIYIQTTSRNLQDKLVETFQGNTKDAPYTNKTE